MVRRPPGSTLTDTLFPYTSLFLSGRVFPNCAPLARFALLAAGQASRMVGAHIKRRRGEGTDFHQMREYRIGDSLRQIDWKATARARKLISREDRKSTRLNSSH